MSSIFRNRLRILLLAISVSLATVETTSAAPLGTTVVVAISGDAAPDGNGNLSEFGTSPTLNDWGQVAFRANFTDSAGNFTGSGVVRGDGAMLTQIARTGQAAPDGDGNISSFFVGNSFGLTALNNAGQVAFLASLSGTSGGTDDNDRIFRGDGVTLTQMASEAQSPPDGNGVFRNLGLSDPALNAAGQVAFRGVLTGTTGGTVDDVGIFRGDGSGLTQIVREGQAAPDGNGSFSNLFASLLNDAGQVAFRFVLTGTSGGSADDSGVFRGDGGTLTLIARAGQDAPDGNGRFSNFNNSLPTLNSAGQVAFRFFLNNTSGGSADDTGIFRGEGSSAPIQVAREGQAAPDGNGTFSGFDHPTLNDVGQTAFGGFLTGTVGGTADDVGLFRGDGVTFTQIAREGQAAPDGNGNFSGFLSTINYSAALNNAGQVALLASLTGTSGGATDDRGIYFFDDVLGLLPVAREGNSFLGSSITQLSFNMLASDEHNGFNERGHVAFQFELADGRSGIAIWSVPEPGTALLALGGLSLVMAAWRRMVLPVSDREYAE
jgi:hypothetical protein